MSLPDGIRTVADRLRGARLTAEEEYVRRWVLERFATGATVSLSSILERSRIAPTEIREILRRLATADLLVLDGTGEIVLAAYPFSSIPTPHRVHLSGREVFALCAVDALGIAAMLKQDARISSRCAHCGSPVDIEARPERVTRHLPSQTVVWFPISSEDNCCPVAESRCPTISFFCASDHLEAWRKANGQPPGVILSLLEAFEAGREIFGSLLAERSARYTRRRS
jgi:hypothetical protein